MTLPGPKDREAFARRAGTRKLYVHQLIATTRWARRPSPALALRLHVASGGVVPLSTLRPDIWPA